MNLLKNTLAIIIFLYSINSLGQANKTKQTKSDPNVPIFEIKNDQQQTVFAVYPGGVKIFVDEQLKATGGGFTVGRLSTGKASAGDILSVTPNNVNIYIDETSKDKATGGGFTVGRLSTGKAGGDVDFLSVTPDSTRVNVSPNSIEGFAVGRLGETGATKFMNVTPNNTFLGYEAGSGIGEGTGNVLLGYRAGANLTKGTSNQLYISNSDTENPLIYGDFLEKFINITGSLLVNGEIISPSDLRLKTNVVKFTNGLQTVMALNSYYFDWNKTALSELGMADRKQIGVIAQEIEKILPELVTVNPKTGYKSVDYVKLTPVLLQAIKEQQQEIETLKEENIKIKEQLTEIEVLKKEIEELKQITNSLNQQNNQGKE